MQVIDPWLPVGLQIGSAKLKRVEQAGGNWQIYRTTNTAAAILVVTPDLCREWVGRGFLPDSAFLAISFAGMHFRALLVGQGRLLSAVHLCPSPNSFADAMSFALALRRTREVDATAMLEHGLFVEQHSLILPDYKSFSDLSDSILLGRYLTGGVPLAVDSRRLPALATWLPATKIAEIASAAGIALAIEESQQRSEEDQPGRRAFRLPGRPSLEAFFREHVVDIVEQPARYQRLGIGFPGAIVLHGPPGTGKTYAVERLAEYLGWPRFDISSETIGSPYIHDTGRKVAALFTAAADSAPAVLVIDEMEAYLLDRGSGEGAAAHRVEEVAEFLRRIPEATRQRVLVVAMTNRLDAIDSAILRRGRFDHIVEVGLATPEEIEALLRDLLVELPHATDVDPKELANAMAGRPLSDVAFVLREAARLTARSDKEAIDTHALSQALEATRAREPEEPRRPRVGFRP